MNATDRLKKRSAAERRSRAERQKTIEETVQYMLYATALILHDEFGFGAGRMQRVCTYLFAYLQDFTENYGSDCLLTALKKKCADRGMEFE